MQMKQRKHRVLSFAPSASSASCASSWRSLSSHLQSGDLGGRGRLLPNLAAGRTVASGAGSEGKRDALVLVDLLALVVVLGAQQARLGGEGLRRLLGLEPPK